MLRWIFVFFLTLTVQSALFSALAHEVRPALLSLKERAPEVYDVTWHRPVIGDKAVSLAPIFPENCQLSFKDRSILATRAARFHYELDCAPVGLRGREVFIEGLSVSLTDVLFNVEFMSGARISHVIRASEPAYKIPTALTAYDVAITYANLGFEHILEGWDHLFFVLALAMLIRSPCGLLGAISGFTLGHSVTLSLVVLGVTPSPGVIIETLIALSVVFLAYEARVAEISAVNSSIVRQFPLAIAALFGLLHGFGFAGALVEIGLSADDLLLSILTFNLGIELGQVLFIALLLLVNVVLIRWGGRPHYLARTAAQYMIGIMASFWVFERFLTRFL